MNRLAVLALVAATATCGGVGEEIRARSASDLTRFEVKELVDVLPPDRIPAIDRPTFEPLNDAAAWLDAADPVVVLAAGAEARAYPLAILLWHEVVNDTVGGVPVVVAFAPLAGAAVAFDRRVGGRTESFGVSGKLYRSDLVMYDRRTRSLWPHLTGRAEAGPQRGRMLARFPAQLTSFEAFRTTFPAGIVLARDPEAGRSYGFNPYEGYDRRAEPFRSFFARRPDPRVPAMERLVGVTIGGEARAYRYTTLAARRVVSDRVGGRDLVVLWQPGTRSALDAAFVARGRDVGSAGVFAPEAAGRRLNLEPAPDGFRDRQTGSTWSVLGVATAGPLAGERLPPIEHADAFWFAWAAFVPATTVSAG